MMISTGVKETEEAIGKEKGRISCLSKGIIKWLVNN